MKRSTRTVVSFVAAISLLAPVAAPLFTPAAALAAEAPALAAAPAPCAVTGSPFLTFTQNITNDADSGNHGDWATDAFTENVNVWVGSDGTTYCANANTTNGTFVTTGPLSPEAGVPLSAGITGNFTGGENYTLPLTLNSDYSTTTTQNVTLPDSSTAGFSWWVNQAFPSVASTSGSSYVNTYSLTYVTPDNGTWTDADPASGGDQGDITGTAPVTVTIDKFIDGSMATASSSNNASFPMNATWDATNIGSGSGSYALGPTGFNSPNPYEAVTAGMTSGASYSTSEDTSGAVVGADCTTGKPYMLAGYKTGDTLADAEAATLSTSTPSFTDMTGNEVVLVYNTMCLAAPVISSPVNGATLTQAEFTSVDWSDVTDTATPVTYTYQASNASTTNADGSFTTPIYTSGPLSTSTISTAGTPEGTYYLQVRAVDADGNMSPWSTTSEVIVDNSATSTASSTPTTGTIGGTVTSTSTGQLAVTSIDTIKGTATADGAFADGWEYIFHITVPTNEQNLAMKFSDWFNTAASSTIPVANNMEIASAQASSTDPVVLTAADTYSSPALHMIGDLSTTTPGLQVEVDVKVAIPTNTVNGSYTTNYGVQTLP